MIIPRHIALLPRLANGELTQHDLVIVAAPGGAEFARTIGDLVDAHADRPLAAIRAFAETPHGLHPDVGDVRRVTRGGAAPSFVRG